MALSAADVKVGDSRTELVFDNITRTQIVQYAGASGDYNPLHSDEVFTTKVAGYPSVFAHGMLTMGMTGRLVTDLVGAANVTSFGGRFTSQVFPGDTSSESSQTIAAAISSGGCMRPRGMSRRIISFSAPSIAPSGLTRLVSTVP